jgi:putative two-component system response regulator
MRNEKRATNQLRVLIADDEPEVARVLHILVESLGHVVVGEAQDGLMAVDLVEQLRPDLVLMDLRMPRMNGLEAAKTISTRFPTPVVAVTGYLDPEPAEKASQAGIMAYLIKPVDRASLTTTIEVAYARFLQITDLASDLREKVKALEMSQAQLLQYAKDLKQSFDREQERSRQLHQAYLDTVKVLAVAVEARDPYTGDHIDRVTRLAVAVAQELGLNGDKLEEVEMGTILHDVGKIGVEDAILRKPTGLAPEEWQAMQAHPQIGARLLSEVDFLKPYVPYVLYHHERYDGKGYPHHLAGEQIPLEGRIVAVADAFDAMTSDRPYRPAMSVETAIQELQRGAGTHFDPTVVAAFGKVVSSLVKETGAAA